MDAKRDSFDELITSSLRGGGRSLAADDAYVDRLLFETRPFAAIRNHPRRLAVLVALSLLSLGSVAALTGVLPLPFASTAPAAGGAVSSAGGDGEGVAVPVRRSEDRPRVVRREIAAAPRDAVDRAIDNALAYLAAQQKENGTFPGSYGDSTAIPSLVGMAFLSKGILPGDGKRGETIGKCLDYVLSCADMRDNQRFKGYFGGAGGGRMYAHSIATLFLAECSGMVDGDRQAKIDEVLPYAVKVIVDAQAQQKSPAHLGGWRYEPGAGDSDLSCSGWALMALKSARLNGAQVPDEAIEKAVLYIRRAHRESDGTFGYQGANGSNAQTLSGAAILCLELCGRHLEPESLRGAKYLKGCFRNALGGGGGYVYYGLYYTAQGLFQIGGEYWKEFEPWMYETYLKKQSADGSWPADATGSPVYSTAMAVLAFTVPYRMLPIYQRDETVDY